MIRVFSEMIVSCALSLSVSSSGATALSVSALSQKLKTHVEKDFSSVIVRGEISGHKKHTSGHHYFALKDEGAVLDAVCWKATAASQNVQLEDGLEVICRGKITTYAARSKYQLVAFSVIASGEGALLKLLEERKRKLAEEGLFAPERKRALPFLPRVIGVITSPTGAVIRDILHRIQDRFPSHVILWPVTVQGPTSAEEIIEALDGLNNLTPRPDVIIVARGGGSIEDLFSFNDELLVRAVAASTIPVISAIGHETDTTLIDYVADVRAPTPTAAAELVVPVRDDLRKTVNNQGHRIERALKAALSVKAFAMQTLCTRLAALGMPTEPYEQYLDDIDPSESIRKILEHASRRYEVLCAKLGRGPRQEICLLNERLEKFSGRTERALKMWIETRALEIRSASQRMRSHVALLSPMEQRILLVKEGLKRSLASLQTASEKPVLLSERAYKAICRTLASAEHAVATQGRLIRTLSHESTLARGFSFVHDAHGHLVSSIQGIMCGSLIQTTFCDGTCTSTVIAIADAQNAENGNKI